MITKYLIAVCDDLRKYQFRNHLLNPINLNYVGEFYSEPLYKMYFKSGDQKVLLYENGTTSILFEVYEIPAISFNNLKYIYLAYDGAQNNKSIIKDIETPYGIAKCFISLEKITDLLLEIEEGDSSIYYGKKI